MPGAQQAEANGSSDIAAAGASKDGQPGDKAMVIYSEAGPALAGGSELALPMEGPGMALHAATGMLLSGCIAKLLKSYPKWR